MYIHLGLRSKRFAVALLIVLAAASASLRAADGRTTDRSSPELSVNGNSDGKASAGNATGAEKAGAPDPAAPFVVELQALKEAVQAQAQQFAEHSRELESERAALRKELDAIERLEEKLGIPSAGAVRPRQAAPQLAVVGPTAGAGQQDVRNQQPINVVTVPNPFSIKIGGADFTPGGFVDLTGIFRSTNDGTSGLSTNLPSIPFNNTLPEGQLSEFRFTSQGSRLSLKGGREYIAFHGRDGLLRKRFQRL